jgi:hypothetical protein
LDVPSGQSIRFEAGDERDVDLVEFGGSCQIVGFNNLMNGSVSSTRTVAEAMIAAADRGFLDGHKDGRVLDVSPASGRHGGGEADAKRAALTPRVVPKGPGP